MGPCVIKEMAKPRADACRAILRGLPEYFGIESALENYAADTEQYATFGAYDSANNLVGFVTLKSHNEFTSEIHVIAIARHYHRRGIGRSLVNFAINRAKQEGFELLEVKTLGPSNIDPFYDQTRAFYVSMGFRPVEEFQGIWENNPCLIMVMPLR